MNDRKMNKFHVIWSVGWALFTVVATVILYNSFEARTKKAADAAYQQGYKDALYKRPVSNDLEMVCAGLWIGEQHKKYEKDRK